MLIIITLEEEEKKERKADKITTAYASSHDPEIHNNITLEKTKDTQIISSSCRCLTQQRRWTKKKEKKREENQRKEERKREREQGDCCGNLLTVQQLP
jgi:hypothetical protein